MYSPKAVTVIMMAASLTGAMTGGCKRGAAPTEEGVVVVSVGDSTLTLHQVLQDIPRGLEPDDSVAMFRAIVETWLRRQVLRDVAEKNISNMDEIERMVEEYRSDLILNRYLALVDESADNSVNNRSVDRYYREHGDSMLLKEPVVKGIFLKVSENDASLPQLREWMRKPDEQAIGHLEKNGLRGAVQYEYFMNRWHAWHEVAELIPYRFFDADAFLESTTDFETPYGGSVYLIHISEYKGTGEKMPEDYARQQILLQLRQEAVASNRQKVVSGIYRRVMDDGLLKAGLYDPSTGKLSELKTNKTKKNE